MARRAASLLTRIGRCVHAQGRLVRGLLLALAPLGCNLQENRASETELIVFAASSLTEALPDLKHGFEASHTGARVRLTYAGSQVLRLQLEQGAPADVFASANNAHMDALERSGVVGRPVVFARNELVVVVPKTNPAKILDFWDLSRAERIVIGMESVPVGKYTHHLFQNAANAGHADFVREVRASVVSEEHNVRLVRAKVELAEADAAIVYRTDAASCRNVNTVNIPASLNVTAEYPIAQLQESAHPEHAVAFIRFVLSSEGQRILARHGFLKRSDP